MTGCAVEVHLVDGTYELFRHYYARARAPRPDGDRRRRDPRRRASVLDLLEDGATHVGVATDHIIESFRNDLCAGYKTGEGIDPVLFAQFPVARGRAARARRRRVGRWSSSRPTTRWRPAARRRRGRPARRARRHLHARQGPRAVRARPAGGPARPARRARSSTRPGVREKFGVAAGVDSRLARARRRQRRRLPGSPGLGREVGRRGARALRHHRVDPGPAGLGRRGARRGEARGRPSTPRATPRCSRCSRRCAPTATSARRRLALDRARARLRGLDRAAGRTRHAAAGRASGGAARLTARIGP